MAQNTTFNKLWKDAQKLHPGLSIAIVDIPPGLDEADLRAQVKNKLGNEYDIVVHRGGDGTRTVSVCKVLQ